jgi:hypothetical protein
LIEMEFALPQPQGYTAFGAACGAKYLDPTVVLVNEAQFSVVSTIGATVSGNYSAMPFLGGGQTPQKAKEMCASDPKGSIFVANWSWSVGSRPYTGAVLLHKASGKEICMISGTFAHCMYQWTDQFIADVEQGCGDRQLLFVADTNAGCTIPTIEQDSRMTFDEIFANHSKANWGPCHDPGLQAAPTCCNDFHSGFPYANYWYDRTAVCRGGRVADFKVHSTFICGDSSEEHLSTMATIHLAEPKTAASPYCLDHPTCTALEMPNGRILPVDGLCCPASASNMSLACCSTVTMV